VSYIVVTFFFLGCIVIVVVFILFKVIGIKVAIINVGNKVNKVSRANS
jgi:hypothetical protein